MHQIVKPDNGKERAGVAILPGPLLVNGFRIQPTTKELMDLFERCAKDIDPHMPVTMRYDEFKKALESFHPSDSDSYPGGRAPSIVSGIEQLCVDLGSLVKPTSSKTIYRENIGIFIAAALDLFMESADLVILNLRDFPDVKFLGYGPRKGEVHVYGEPGDRGNMKDMGGIFIVMHELERK